jgi:hypothetical protein
VNVPLLPLDYMLDVSVRDAVRRIMDAHPKLAKPLSAAQINARLPPHLRRLDGTIRHHMRVIWKEHTPIDVSSINPRALQTQ